MQQQMKSHYNFKNQIAHIDQICQTNIIQAEIANHYLKDMCPQLIRRICQEVKGEYEEEYQKDKDKEKMHSIRQVLNLLQREQVTNVDELCMDLREDLNSYYETEGEAQLLKCRKYKPYLKKCQQCKLQVSNHMAGLNNHIAKSCKAIQNQTQEAAKVEEDSTAPITTQKQIKKVDTKFLYEQRQNGLSDFEGVKIEEPEERMSKRQMMELKRQRKLEEDRLKKQRRMEELKRIFQKGTSLSKTNSEYYYQQEDDELAKKYNSQEVVRLQEQKQHSQPSSARSNTHFSFAQ